MNSVWYLGFVKGIVHAKMKIQPSKPKDFRLCSSVCVHNVRSRETTGPGSAALFTADEEGCCTQTHIEQSL